MKHRDRILDRLVDLSVFSGGTLPGVSLIEIISDKRVLLEHHHGVCKYTHEQICVKSEFGIIKICGNGLHIKNLSADQVMVVGRIESVQLCRGGRFEK